MPKLGEVVHTASYWRITTIIIMFAIFFALLKCLYDAEWMYASTITYRMHSVLKVVLSEHFRGEGLGVRWPPLERCDG